ncbi:MAG: hypothetical protein AAGA91_06485 [Pseudomonadota bacterium]
MLLITKWWIVGEGLPWEQWARIDRGGRITLYDSRGNNIIKANYRNRFRAAAALRHRGFRRVNTWELRRLPPPRLS